VLGEGFVVSEESGFDVKFTTAPAPIVFPAEPARTLIVVSSKWVESAAAAICMRAQFVPSETATTEFTGVWVESLQRSDAVVEPTLGIVNELVIVTDTVP
jgi:hypothetical protein